MADTIIIELIIVEPVMLDIEPQPINYIGTLRAGPQGEKGEKGDSAFIVQGMKSSAVDAGNFGDISITNDYVFFCVQTGIAGQAIWKKSLMFLT